MEEFPQTGSKMVSPKEFHKTRWTAQPTRRGADDPNFNKMPNQGEQGRDSKEPEIEQSAHEAPRACELHLVSFQESAKVILAAKNSRFSQLEPH